MGRAPRAARAAWTVLGEVRELAAHGWPAGLAVLSGSDLYHIDAAVRLVLEALLDPAERETGLTVFADGPLEVGAVVAAARSRGMFASRRVVLVRDAALLQGDPAPLAAFAESAPPRGHLIVRAPKLDARLKLHQTLLSSRRFDFVLREDAPGLVAQVAALARSKGLELREDAGRWLAEVCGGDLYRVDGELEKLLAWLGPQGERAVTRALAQQLALGGHALTAWQLADGIQGGQRAKAWTALCDLLDAGEEPLRVIGALAYRARLALKDDPRLLAFPGLLLGADRTLKSRGLAPAAVLGLLVERMIAVASGGKMARPT